MKIIIGLISFIILAILVYSLEANLSQQGAGLFGVLLGAGIAIFVNYLNNSRQDKRSSLDRNNAILLASLDKRLETHQKAYTYVRKLAKSAHSTPEDRSKSLPPLIQECGQFWDENALYLTQEAKEKLQLLLFNIVCLNSDQTPTEDRMQVYDLIGTTGRAITEGVSLFLSDEEFKELKDGEE